MPKITAPYHNEKKTYTLFYPNTDETTPSDQADYQDIQLTA